MGTETSSSWAREETLWAVLFGEVSERVAEDAIAPVLVVRRRQAAESTSG